MKYFFNMIVAIFLIVAFWTANNDLDVSIKNWIDRQDPIAQVDPVEPVECITPKIKPDFGIPMVPR